MKTAHEQGLEWGSCKEAQALRDACPPDTMQKQWYEELCPARGDWLLWDLQWLTHAELLPVLPQIKEIAQRHSGTYPDLARKIKIKRRE